MMSGQFRWVPVAFVMALAAGATSAQEQTDNRVAASTDWSVFQESDPVECFSVSAPKEQLNTRDGQPVEVQRGETLLFVFYRPAEGVNGQVTFTGGYPFASGSTVSLDVGGTVFQLFTEGEWAWPATPEDDARIVAAMKAGFRPFSRASRPRYRHARYLLASWLHRRGRGSLQPLRLLTATEHIFSFCGGARFSIGNRAPILYATPSRMPCRDSAMTATAPITQDVLTIPRKLPQDGPVNLVGLTRDAMRAASSPPARRKAGQDARGQIWQWIYHWGVRDFAAMTNLAKDYARLLADHFTITLPEIVTKTGLRGWHPQIPRPHRRRARGRDRLHPRGGSRHALHLFPGRLHAHLFLLPHRHAEARPQPHSAAKSWAGHACPRRPGRMAHPARPRMKPSTLQHRPHGHGRTALQLRQRPRRDEDRDGPRRYRLSRAASRSPLGRGAEIARTANEIGCLLAISFHATTDEIRDRLVPINKRWNIATLLDALRDYRTSRTPSGSLSNMSCSRASTTPTPTRAGWSS